MSSDFSTGPPPFDPRQAKPRQSSGLAWKIVLGILGGGLVMTVLCAGGAFFAFRDTFSANPQRVESLAQEIAAIHIPDYWRPTMSMSMAGVRMAIFDGVDGRGAFVLIDAIDAVRRERQAFENEMRQRINKQINRPGRFENDSELESRREPFTIKGEQIELEVVTSEGSRGTTYHEVSGSFQGNENLAFIYVKAPQDEFSEDEIRRMIESIE